MKTFKIAQLVVVALLLSGSSMYAFFGGCCGKRERVSSASCCPKKSCATVKLPIEQVQFSKTITETCEQPPSIKYFVKKVVTPCSNQNKERTECMTACPKYEGTYDEDTGERID
jgi:hypothetical protein